MKKRISFFKVTATFIVRKDDEGNAGRPTKKLIRKTVREALRSNEALEIPGVEDLEVEVR